MLIYVIQQNTLQRAQLATAIPSVRLSVRPSVTRRYCVKVIEIEIETD